MCKTIMKCRRYCAAVAKPCVLFFHPSQRGVGDEGENNGKFYYSLTL